MVPILRICSRKSLKIIENISRRQYITNLCVNFQSTPFCAIILTSQPQHIRYKSKKTSKIPQQQITESETENSSNEDIFDSLQNKHSKIMNIVLPSLRVDTILKSSLGLARNKVDLMFYENRIRLNGEKILKKNVTVSEGDEIDLVKNISPTNPDNLIVARVEILSLITKEDTIQIKIRRCKSLAVENYPGANTWKG